MGDETLLERILNGDEEPKDLPLALLQSITNDFSQERKIGQGGFGAVYKGELQNGIIVAVKRIEVNQITIDDVSFCREFNSLMNTNHRNVVRFLGFCSNTHHIRIKLAGEINLVSVRERLLCFEYIRNGSLDKHITDELRGLEWEPRYAIISGICKGLFYLHEEKKIVHMDLKPPNILLDDHMVPKITNFGLSRSNEMSHTTGQRFGTPGYVAPEYEKDGKTSFKCDIYSLGVIITELVTGRKSVPHKNNVLRRWRHRWNKPLTLLQYRQVTRCIEISVRCRQQESGHRPSILEIVNILGESESMDGHTGQESSYLDDDMLRIEPLELKLNEEMSWLVTSTGSGELLSGLQDTPAPRKRPAKETAGSSGESTTSAVPPMKVNPGAQAKRRKTVGSSSGTAADAPARGPSSDPAPAAPATAAPASSAPPVAAKAAATSDAPPAPKPATQDTAPPAPDSTAAGPDSTPEVVVTGAAFSPPVRNVLTRHVDGAGSSTPAKLELGARLLDNLSTDELYAGFLSQLNAHRGEELQLVNQLKKRYEETATGLRDEAAASQTAKEVVEEKLRAAIQKLGELETELSTVRNTAETREGELVKRAEEAEGRLKVATDELADLHKHESRMTEAIFGKKSRQLSSDRILKLKAVYTLTEQLYCGAVYTIKAMMGKKSIPGSLRDVLDLLSTLPQHFCELRKSAARKGAIAGLSRALAYAPELTTEDMMGGFPSLKDDGTEFSDADYKKCLKDSRLLASTLVEETDCQDRFFQEINFLANGPCAHQPQDYC